MPTPIHPDTVKSIRALKRWTQEQLAEATRGKHKVGLATIKRIEGTKTGSYEANDRVAEGLARALGVTVQALSTPGAAPAGQQPPAPKPGMRQLRTMIDEETTHAFRMVEQLYGIPPQTQIVMAPLFAALLAEASLDWRRDRAERMQAAAREVSSLATGHLAAARASNQALNCAAWELSRIANRDLFCDDAPDEAYEQGYDPNKGNPFSDFLAHFIQQIGARTVEIAPGGGWKTRKGMPRYRIGAEAVAQITARDPEASYALMRGHVRMTDIPAELMAPERLADRNAWLASHLPEAERAELRARRERTGRDRPSPQPARPAPSAPKSSHSPKEQPDA
ncbi:helix-turn-helix transcriptional regulator [Neotabrizicola shimadae]|uniref:Helix-turn-helix transcriptional regulator n=1 Tax=Neotabrizicola shimadae TaxID=2807096 RepID=A0A8G1EDN5_9RHOB|nr:helix-turn-helix transcriptional regulator [Neotabrizicola shimadae]QYZ71712.1 helix-turn-helix transcriptional regulator [Neotabrizicola shimadae]